MNIKFYSCIYKCTIKVIIWFDYVHVLINLHKILSDVWCYAIARVVAALPQTWETLLTSLGHLALDEVERAVVLADVVRHVAVSVHSQ